MPTPKRSYVVDTLDGNVYDQNHRLADPVDMLAEINRLKALLTDKEEDEDTDLRNHQCGDIGEMQYDGYNIYLCTTCPVCHDAKMGQFRSDIGTQYECDEPIEPEEY